MRHFLRNRKTGCYFQGVADWTKDLEKAFNFRSPERAARFVAAAKLKATEMELILAFDDPRYNIPLPIDGRYGVSGLSYESSESGWHLPSVLPGPARAEADRRYISLET